jgi:hypothetical protein
MSPQLLPGLAEVMLFNQAPAIRILIADDHEVVRSGLRSIVECHQQKGPAAGGICSYYSPATPNGVSASST